LVHQHLYERLITNTFALRDLARFLQIGIREAQCDLSAGLVQPRDKC
jgi:hypothetical protein